MSKRNIIEVDEEALRRKMANSRETYLPGITAEKKPEYEYESFQEVEEPEQKVENVKTQKNKKNFKSDFSDIFLKDNKISDRRQIYISKEAYDKISRYLRYIGKGNVSLVSYVDNILFHHMDEYRDTINDLYNKNISTPL